MHLSFAGDRYTKALQADDLTLPPLSEAREAWAHDGATWALYTEPPVLIHQTGTGPWAVATRFDFHPEGLVLLEANRLLAWGTKPISTPEKGIPYIVEESNDAGKTWKPFSIPKVDFLTKIQMENNVLLVEGIQLPKDGLPPGKTWFELQPTHFLSQDGGRQFSQIAGVSFWSIQTVIGKTVSPDGHYTAYLVDNSFRDSSFIIYLADQPDSLPHRVLDGSGRPQIVWSGNSQVLALQEDDKFFTCYDCRNRQIPEETAHKQKIKPSLKETQVREEKDRTIRAILHANQ